jgi:hypothetical protein
MVGETTVEPVEVETLPIPLSIEAEVAGLDEVAITHESVEDWPDVIEDGEAVKDEMVGTVDETPSMENPTMAL